MNFCNSDGQEIYEILPILGFISISHRFMPTGDTNKVYDLK
jgi:hypothetical protein